MLPFPVYSSTSTVFAPAFIVIVSVLALVVIVVPVPATNVNVSSTPSATTSDCPDTEIVLNTFPPAVPQLKFPEPSVLSAVPFEPSAEGNTHIWFADKAGASNPT